MSATRLMAPAMDIAMTMCSTSISATPGTEEYTWNSLRPRSGQLIQTLHVKAAKTTVPAELPTINMRLYLGAKLNSKKLDTT